MAYGMRAVSFFTFALNLVCRAERTARPVNPIRSIPASRNAITITFSYETHVGKESIERIFQTFIEKIGRKVCDLCKRAYLIYS